MVGKNKLRQINNKKKAMTLVALLVTMSVTCILLGMFIPILTQGLVNIASGKSFDGSVSLSRRNGYFICYYKGGDLTQTRADVQPNGRDVNVVTKKASNKGCEFEIPTWPESFKLTLIGGGGAGATPKATAVDEEKGEEIIENSSKSDLKVEYNFTDIFNNKNNIYKQFMVNSSVYLNAGDGVTYSHNDLEGKALTFEVDKTSSSLTIIAQNASYLATSTNRDYVFSYKPFLGNTSTTPLLYVRGSSLRLPKSLTFKEVQKVIKVNEANGGNAGEIVEKIVPFFEESTAGTGVMLIKESNIGKGGSIGRNGGIGGSTSLILASGEKVEAKGGSVGTTSEKIIRDDDGASTISAKDINGNDGEINRFIPQPLKIIDLVTGFGANTRGGAGHAATYPGAGGGGGAVYFSDYTTESGSDSGCFDGRGIVNKEELLDCRFNDEDWKTFNGVGGNGAPGAVLIAW